MEISWTQHPIDPRVAKFIAAKIASSNSYSPWSSTGEIENLYDSVSGILPVGLKPEIAKEVVSHIRSVSITEEIIKRHPAARSAAHSKHIQRVYSSRGILEASRAAKVPPMGLFKEMMILAGYSGELTLKAMNNRVNPEVYFQKYDLEQMKIACENDASCPAHQASRLAISEANENTVVEFFRAAKIPFRTQEQLKDSGITAATPDILFDSPVRINGVQCIWLDNKDFTALPQGKVHDSAIKQAERNNRIYGPGAFLTRGTCVLHIGESPVFDTLDLFTRGADGLLVPTSGIQAAIKHIDTPEESFRTEIDMPKSRSKSKSNRRSNSQGKSRRSKRGGSQPSSRSRYSSRSAKATDQMSITQLQIMAKQRGIPFAGLSKQKLIERINKYIK